MDTMIPVKSANQDLDVIVFGRAGMDLYPHPPARRPNRQKHFAAILVALPAILLWHCLGMVKKWA